MCVLLGIEKTISAIILVQNWLLNACTWSLRRVRSAVSTKCSSILMLLSPVRRVAAWSSHDFWLILPHLWSEIVLLSSLFYPFIELSPNSNVLIDQVISSSIIGDQLMQTHNRIFVLNDLLKQSITQLLFLVDLWKSGRSTWILLIKLFLVALLPHLQSLLVMVILLTVFVC